MTDFTAQFSEYKFTPKQEALFEIQHQMREMINDLALLYTQTWHGFLLLREHFDSERESLIQQLTDDLGGGGTPPL